MFDQGFAVSVLIVDDEKACRFANRILTEEAFAKSKIESSELNIKEASSVDEALYLLSVERFNIVLLDRDLGQDHEGKSVDGIEHIPEIRNVQPTAQILVITGHDDTKLAVRAMQLGAAGYLVKSDSDSARAYREEQLLLALQRSKAEIEERRSILASVKPLTDYVCKSPAMQSLEIKLQSLAQYPVAALFLGDSGLGKTSAAKRLCELRAKYLKQVDRPFLNINISGLQDSLADSILFGHEKGAFTGADRMRQGYFELANGGDLFLDEIGDASMELQKRLLKVIDEREFERVGGGRLLGSCSLRTKTSKIWLRKENSAKTYWLGFQPA
jgi:DNA-binding NtrC family response regulator